MRVFNVNAHWMEDEWKAPDELPLGATNTKASQRMDQENDNRF